VADFTSPLRATTRSKWKNLTFSSSAEAQDAISRIGALWGSGGKMLDFLAGLALCQYLSLARRPAR
jgi:hypothetical protein